MALHTSDGGGWFIVGAMSPALMAAVGYDAASVSAGLVGASLAAGRSYMSLRSGPSAQIPGRLNLFMVFTSGASLSMFAGPYIARQLGMIESDAFVFIRLMLGMIGSMFVDLILSKGNAISAWLAERMVPGFKDVTLPQPTDPSNPTSDNSAVKTEQSTGEKTSK